MVGKAYEEGGIIKNGAKLRNKKSLRLKRKLKNLGSHFRRCNQFID